jgi:hypothetical protein
MTNLHKSDPIKFCVQCGKQLIRKRSLRGVLESPVEFNKRKFCNNSCKGAQMKFEYHQGLHGLLPEAHRSPGR